MNETLDLDLESGVDLLTGDALRDPYPVLAALREQAPVYWNPEYRAWFIHRYDDLRDALNDPRFSSDRIRPVFEHKLTPQQQQEREPTYRILGDWMVFRDPPDHTRLRKLVSRAFTPRAISLWRPQIERTVDQLLTELAPVGRMDLIQDFAYPVPAVVIAEMMGVPTEDIDLFKDWSDDVMILVFGARGVEGRRERAQQGLIELSEYLMGLVTRFRSEPEENLITALVEAQEGDDSLTDDEVVATLVLMLFGGHETTTNLIGNGLRALLMHPDELGKLRANPDPEFLRMAIEELLRFDGPSKMQVRMTTEEIELRGETIGSEEMVYLVQAAANHDPGVFEDPDRLDLERDPTSQIGFGFGIHFCLGAAVARLEGSIALDAIIRRLPDLELEPDSDHWHPTLISRGMESLTVNYTPSDGTPFC